MHRSPLFYASWPSSSAALLLCGACLGTAHAATPFGHLLAAYRADRLCDGPGFRAANDAVDDDLTLYHMQDASAANSRALGAAAAGAADALAATAAGKGCKALATELWRFVIRYFDGPAFAAYQRQAVTGLLALRREEGGQMTGRPVDHQRR